ncbi:transglutaminase TgpA family protein [Luteimonas dalianensis]|uniref:transglutaminase TgpA family protein n=1 Tax=Luteimonas dalianensis TaxID=1148196 RepID=UPI003BF35092
MLDQASRRWALAAAGACLLPLLLQLPGHVALGVGGLGLLGAVVSLRVNLPAWPRPLLALALFGLVLANYGFHFGRDTGCALLAAMLAIKPMELRDLRDARSLLGFALFAPFATFLLDQGPLSLLLGLAGVVLALMALLRLSELESVDRGPARTGETEATARGAWRRLRTVGRLVAVGLPLALAAFWLFPRMASPMWGVPDRAMARPGLSDTMSPGEWIDFMSDDSPAARVTFNGPVPGPHQMYWRGPVMLDFDGRTWKRSEWLAGLPPAEAARGEPVWDYEIEIEPTDRRHVVALDLPLAAPDGVRLSRDFSMTSPRPLSQLRRFSLRSAPPAAFEPELPQMLRQLALRLPEGFNPRTRALGLQWRAEAGVGPAADAAIVRRSLQWVTDEFAYTMATPLPGRHSVDEFLFDQKEGFCEHYSSAFAVLLRATGIPTRVVTGYAGGYRNRFGDYWIVRNMDAHAWVEAWLEGRGWVRVDPTAAVAPERIFDTLEDRQQAGGLDALGNFVAARDLGDWLRRGWNTAFLGFDAARQRQLLSPIGIRDLGISQLIILFSALAGLALAWMLWLVARGERERDPVLRAWRRLGRRYAPLGLAPEAHEPATAWAGRIVQAHPGAAAGLAPLSARFVDWRYAGEKADPATGRALARDLDAHRPDRRAPLEDPT